MFRFAPLLGVLAHVGSSAHLGGLGYAASGASRAASGFSAPAMRAAAVASTAALETVARPIATAALGTLDAAEAMRPEDFTLPDVWSCESALDCARADVCDRVTRAPLSDHAGFVVWAGRSATATATAPPSNIARQASTRQRPSPRAAALAARICWSFSKLVS